MGDYTVFWGLVIGMFLMVVVLPLLVEFKNQEAQIAGYDEGLYEHDMLKYTYYQDIEFKNNLNSLVEFKPGKTNYYYAQGYIQGCNEYLQNTKEEKDKKAAGL